MKKYSAIFGFLFILSFTSIIISCNGNKASTEQSEEKMGKEYTSKYICPMHCKDSGAEEAGKCPVCKMDYVLNKEHKH